MSTALLRCWSHHRFHTTSSCTKTRSEQTVLRAADFPPMAGGQILVILPIQGVASLYQDMYDHRFHQISLGRERHVDHVRLMGMEGPAQADAQMTRGLRLSSRKVRVTWRYWPSIDRRDGCQSVRRRRSHESGSAPTGSGHPGPTLPPPQ